MIEHRFLLQQGIWQGDGKICFSMAEDELDFTMHWTILPLEQEQIFFNQLIDIPTLGQTMKNSFTLSELAGDRFTIQLENQIIGKVVGKGVIDFELIAWEFREPKQAFEGYEVYELQEDQSYKMRGEFSGGDGMRTYVSGSISKS